MKKYYIEVTETLQRIVSVEAENLEEAYEQVEEWANEGEGLTYEDFVSRDFEDRTQYCEDRDPTIKDAFFDITIRDFTTVFDAINRDIKQLYQEEPNISYDQALRRIWNKEYFGHTLTANAIYHYPSGWTGPVVFIRKLGEAIIEGYIAVNSYNKIQVVKNMTEVK